MARFLQAMRYPQRIGLIIKKIARKHRNQIAIFVFLALGWLFFFQNQPNLPDTYIGKDVSVIIKAMPRKDRKKLEYFFQRLVRDGVFGYVLLGNKPMAHETFWASVNPFACLFLEKISAKNNNFIPTLCENFLFYLDEAISLDRIKFNQSYEIWMKYKKFFPMSRFCLFYENSQTNIFDDLTITLVNKSAFIQKVRQHDADFHMVLNRKICGEELLMEGLSKSFLAEVLMHHDGLIGTLLGYGRDHAFWYHQKYRLHSDKEKREFGKKFYLASNLPDEIGRSWTDEEYARFRKDNKTSALWTFPPCFRADPTSSETRNLRRQYLETRQLIANYYSGKDFLETTLRLLTSKEDKKNAQEKDIQTARLLYASSQIISKSDEAKIR